VGTQRGAGVVSELDVLRARAEVENGRRAIAEVESTRATLVRSLETLTGLRILPPYAALPPDDLRAEAPLDSWLVHAPSVPTAVAARHRASASEATASQQRAALLPTLEAEATERFTNAPGFGKSPYYSVAVIASWQLDLATYTGSRAADAAAQAERFGAERGAAAARDAIRRLASGRVAHGQEQGCASSAGRFAADPGIHVARVRGGHGVAHRRHPGQARRLFGRGRNDSGRYRARLRPCGAAAGRRTIAHRRRAPMTPASFLERWRSEAPVASLPPPPRSLSARFAIMSKTGPSLAVQKRPLSTQRSEPCRPTLVGVANGFEARLESSPAVPGWCGIRRANVSC
jgi:hypothetical protein